MLRVKKSTVTLFYFFILSILGSYIASGKEGMWIPATLKSHADSLKAMGLEIPIDEIYNSSGTGLNNAVVLFGRGCTGELISSQGLVLTNHHCGYGTVQGLSSTDKDYFLNGFFAKNLQEEIPCPGLTVTFVRRMENVTDKVLPGIKDTMSDTKRDSIIAVRIAGLEKEYEVKTGMDATIKPYYEGNQYWVAITETYRDIRLVGFPPNGIGQFGGDDENWVWPRHTGDFSVFRVYAGADNKPAPYAASNKPYSTNKYFNINIKGYKEGDLTMVYGFPGTTMEYISSSQLNQVYSITDPISIAARTLKLKTWDKHMNASRDIFIKYTSKRAGVANGWKKWQGEMLGLKANNAIEKKKVYEMGFQAWADKEESMPYARTLLPQLSAQAQKVDSLIYLDQHIREDLMGIELIQQGAAAEKLMACFRAKLSENTLQDSLKKVVANLAWFYKNYDATTDEDIFTKLMPLYLKNCKGFTPTYYREQYKANRKRIKRWAKAIYDTSMFASQARLTAFAANAQAADSTTLLADPAWQLYNTITTLKKEKIGARLTDYNIQKHYLNRLYMNAQMAYDQHKQFYPDANLTLRLTYGKLQGIKPEADNRYSYQTTLDEVVALDDTSSLRPFKVPQKLKDLYTKKDYGRWGVNGTVPVAFVAANHTSGGNSGSPVLNAKGELIGTNFDRAYEGTMSDYLFDPKLCRNISVDIRYTLFIIDKFGGAGWLLNEMTIN